MGFRIMVFTNDAIGTATRCIKVAQAGAFQVVCDSVVGQNAFEHEFAGTVGIDWVLRMLFIDGHVFRIAVGGAGRRKDEGFAIVLEHGIEQHEGGGDIVVVILCRVGHRFGRHRHRPQSESLQ